MDRGTRQEGQGRAPFWVVLTLAATTCLLLPSAVWAAGGAGLPDKEVRLPHLIWVTPFTVMLLCIALLPLLPHTHHWWESNWSKLGVAVLLALVTTLYYWLRGFGMRHGGHVTEPGLPIVALMLDHAFVVDYLPFLVMLFSLYVISGGLLVRTGLPPSPATNTGVLTAGAALASFIGTTGASMLLIRPLLETNRRRRHVTHTVVFFIFLVSNVGGCLLPLGDPPLFLGYLRGVPFTWTLGLWPEWLASVLALLAIYYILDSRLSRSEEPAAMAPDPLVPALRLRGAINFVWLAGVILCVALLVGGKPLPGTSWTVPPLLREGLLLAMAGLSWVTTPRGLRAENRFGFTAIGEVAALFVGIFVCMQVPMEILKERGGELGLTRPWEFFWATGLLSSVLDNAPTYAVFFETAGNFGTDYGPVLTGVAAVDNTIPVVLLRAVSLGAVLMGANSYIGNGPNFMVKSIAEEGGVKMPSFFGYLAYSAAVLLPLFVALTLLFIR